VRKEARLLKDKAVDALLLGIESFNRPYDRGRADSVVRDLSHAFEMLMKAAIIQRGGRIRERRATVTLGFETCVRKGLSDNQLKFLTTEQALTIQMLNALRDAAEHYLVEMSEQQLYIQAQAATTLFGDILWNVFGERLGEHLPERVLPLSTNPPRDLAVLVRDEVALIRQLIEPGTRRRVEARARARSLAIMDEAIGGEFVQPGDRELDRLLSRVGAGESWDKLFPGVASLELNVGGDGIPFSLRIAKKEGVPIQLVKEGTPGAAVVAIRKVDKLAYYNMGLRKLSQHFPELSEARVGTIVTHLRLRDSDEYYAEFSIDSQHYKRYSQKALDRIRAELPAMDVAAIWQEHRPRRG
jgi:hypothetical protein